MLNLLPPNEKIFLTKEKQKKLFIILYFELLIFLVCVFLVQLSIAFYVLGESASQNFLLQQVKAERQSPEFSYLKNVIQDYNQKLVLIDSFYQKQKFSGNALRVLLQVQRPAGLYFTRFSLQSQEQSDRINVIISGFSGTRDNLLIFKNNIEAEKNIENVNFSPESWISSKNITFNLTLNIVDGK